MLSIPHLIIIFVVALVVFGPEKLPELARNLGKVMADFKRATGDFRSTFEDHLRDLERETTDRKIGGGTNLITTNAPPLPPAPSAQVAENSPEATTLPPAPGAVTANEPYLSRSSAPDHALEDDPKSFPEVNTEASNEVLPDSTSDSVSNGRKRPG
jgi:sec-independent protein translocase protein TatB